MANVAKTGCLALIGLAVGILLVAGGVVVSWQLSIPTASYRYRLTIAVEADGQTYSGSSVIDVWYSFNSPWAAGLANGVQFNTRLRGQAVAVDLGERGVLVAALNGQPNDYTSISAESLAGRAFLPDVVQPKSRGFLVAPETVEAISRARGSVELQSNNMPAFFWFSDKTDPATAKAVRPADFSAVIGDATRLVSAKVEITQDPIVIDIDQKLPLYKKLPQPPGLILDVNDKLIVNWGMFIAP